MTKSVEKKKPLSTLVIEMAEIVAQLSENGGELTQELEKAMDCTSQELQAKADSYAFFMDRLDAEAKYWNEKADQYARVARSCKSLKERLNNNIKAAMRTLGEEDLKGEEMRFKLSTLAPKLVIDEARLPSSYKMIETELVPDKERIKQELEGGAVIEGAKLEEVFSLRKYLNNKDRK